MADEAKNNTQPDALQELKELEAKSAETVAALQPPTAKPQPTLVQKSGMYHEENGVAVPTWEIVVSMLIRKFGTKIEETGDVVIELTEEDLINAALPNKDLVFMGNEEGTVVTLAVVEGAGSAQPLTQEEARIAVALATDLKTGNRTQESLTEDEKLLLMSIGRSMGTIAQALKDSPKEAAMWEDLLTEANDRMVKAQTAEAQADQAEAQTAEAQTEEAEAHQAEAQPKDVQ